MTSNDVVVLSNLATWNLWPTAFGNSNSDALSGTETSGTVSASWNGNISYTAAGAGTVILPGGLQHNNCLQVAKHVTMAVTGGTYIANLDMTQYEYWSSLTKFPILTVEYQTLTTGTVVAKKGNVWVNVLALTVGVNEVSSNKSEFVLYPSPASDLVHVGLPDGAVASRIEIIDMSGRVVANSDHSNSINVSSLAKSVYSVRVTSDQGVSQKRLVLKP